MIEFSLQKEKFELVNDNGEKFLPKGMFKIYMGGAVPNERSIELGASKPIIFHLSDNLIR
jgi:beta-glucosidase